ncbi:MFS transporter [Planobispora longispora]|uniref:MFS transporter n=1 Tax=Planobispora longispora TaxID=28887 RepID=A0A8J3RMU7_9ACTN|nr:MFS transporter [Planobispora longispora]GIH79511.1 MFS transporter [Planobispora longispora]
MAEKAQQVTDASAADGTTDDVADRPATFREVFGVAEYRYLFASAILSWIGDYFARVAVAYLIFSDTGSVLLSAAGFAVSFLPWVAGGPILAALAERYPYRRVMILCDVARTALIALMAVPGVPLPALLLLLLAASVLTPPFQAARSALLAQVLTGDRYVVGLSLQNIAGQTAQVAGYAVGGVITAVDARVALLLNAASFAASALLLRYGVRPRPAAATATARASLLRETADGARVVFGHRVMRPIALVAFSMVAIVIVPEGLAVAWAADLGGGSRAAGLLMAALPVGSAVGAVVIGRMMTPERRIRLIRLFLLAGPLLLVPALLSPPLAAVFLMMLGAGIAGTVIVPLNGLFVQVLPSAFRARAFGLMQGGMQITHAVAVLAAGALAEAFSVATVVGIWSLCGLALMTVAVTRWPSKEVIDTEVARAAELNRPAPASG